MSKYFYRAVSPKLGEKIGFAEAKNAQELAHTLREKGYILVKAELAKKEENSRKISFLKALNFFSAFRRVSLKEKIFFVRNLRVMLKSGISLPRALTTLTKQARQKKFKKALFDIAERVTKGESFSQALSYYPDIFPEIFQSMIVVGEESGTLEEILRGLTEQMEKEQEIRSKIVGAMVYPIVILVAMIGIGVLMLVVVVPKLAETFRELNVELPFTTRLVVWLGTFLAEKWYWLILIIFLLIVSGRILLKSDKGHRFISGIFLKIPFISSMIEKTNSARTARMLSILISSGIPIVRSLEILSDTIGNFYFKKVIKDAVEKVRSGQKIYEALRTERKLYPLLFLEMVEIGEETGETASILAKLADFYEEEISNITKNLSSVIEPVLMLIIGSIVGFFAVSMLQPMYSMLQAIK